MTVTVGFLDKVIPELMALFRERMPDGCEFLPIRENTPEERMAVARQSDVLMVWSGPISRAEIEAPATPPRLVQTCSQGFEKLDFQAATERGVPVCNGGGGNTTSVAEFTVSLMVAVYRRLLELDASVRNGKWRQPGQRPVSFDIAGKTVGIIGLGTIGKKVARRLHGWECDVVYHDIVRPDPEMERSLNVRFLPFDELLAQADLITLHVPLDASTRGMIGATELRKMKRGSILLNFARGGLVDEQALYQALVDGHLLGAGVDVRPQEPPDPASPLHGLTNVVFSPHAAAGTMDAASRCIDIALGNVDRVMRGEQPLHMINASALESARSVAPQQAVPSGA